MIDHVVFVVHGIGTTCDLQFRNIIDCGNVFHTKPCLLFILDPL
jgi:hypothetical protein